MKLRNDSICSGILNFYHELLAEFLTEKVKVRKNLELVDKYLVSETCGTCRNEIVW